MGIYIYKIDWENNLPFKKMEGYKTINEYQ